MLKTIRHNDTGDLVKVARYLTGNAERKAASATFDASFVSFVCSYQSNNGLTSDGVIGPKTWTKIASKAPTCSTAKNKTSAATCAVQLLIGGLDVDGIYGTKTKNAVAAYQSSKGLTADGICGPKTWNALITGEACGAAFSAIAGRGAGSDYVIAWDDAAIAPLRPEGAVEFLWHDKLKGAADVSAKRAELAKEYKATLASAQKAAELGVIDSVIAAADTRKAVIEALDLLEGKRVTNLPKKHSNIPF